MAIEHAYYYDIERLALVTASLRANRASKLESRLA
jgi:hypothetical protein